VKTYNQFFPALFQSVKFAAIDDVQAIRLAGGTDAALEWTLTEETRADGDVIVRHVHTHPGTKP
jgi:hypothetical protein